MDKSKREIDNLDPEFPFYIYDTSSDTVFFDFIDVYQIIIQKKGRIFYHASGKDHVLSGKHIIFIPPGIRSPVKNSVQSEMLQFVFGRQFLDSIITIIASSIEENVLRQFHLDSQDQQTDNNIVYISLDEPAFSEINQIATGLSNELLSKNQGYRQMIRIKFMELLLGIFRLNQFYKDDIKTSAPGIENIYKISEFINERYSDDLTLNGIAGHFGLNPSYLSRIFRQATGTALFEYINKIRIQKSCMLLKKTSMTIIEIAYSVGYNNISHFNRYFRKIMKMSPRQYKKYIKK